MLSDPISLRLDESVVNALKQEARRLSFEEQKDVSYVDLVRKAVESYLGDFGATANNIEIKIDNTDKTYKSEITKEAMMAFFGIRETGSTAELLSKRLKETIDNNSIARQVLFVDTRDNAGYGTYERDVASVAYIIERRGAVPEQKCEGNKITIPPFEIAAHPSFTYADIEKCNAGLLEKSTDMTAEAIVKEENSNLIALFKAAANYRQDQIIPCVETITISHLEEAFAKILQHDSQPAYIICHPSTLFMLMNSTPGNPQFTRTGWTSLHNKDRIEFKNAIVLTTSRIDQNEIIVTGNRQKLGVFFADMGPCVVGTNEPTKLRAGYVAWERIGMGILNDYLIAMVRKEERKIPTPILPVPTGPVPFRFIGKETLDGLTLNQDLLTKNSKVDSISVAKKKSKKPSRNTRRGT